MPDRTDDFLPRLRQHRLPGLDLGAEFLYPNYNGYSILNLPSSICRWLGAPVLGAPPLASDLLASLGEGFDNVILVVVDALALHRLRRWLSAGDLPVFDRLLRNGLLAPLTSITPSTTSAAITSLWTGRSATEHGMTGYEMWMKEYGMVVNTILNAPSTFRQDAGSLAKAGFNPETNLHFSTLGEHLEAHGVRTIVFQHYGILNSGLSQMVFRNVQRRAFGSGSDLWVNLRQAVESRGSERQYLYVYWSELDSLGHRYGPDDERALAELAGFSAGLERMFLEKVRPDAIRNTLLVLVADHGQVVTRKDLFYELDRHPGLVRRLHIQPTGENRLAYLYVRPGQMEAVREFVERTWRNQFVLLESAYAVENGLFGPGAPHPRLADRVGDLIAVARMDAYWWWAGEKENLLIGRHGGLHPDEMLVPFLAVSL